MFHYIIERNKNNKREKKGEERFNISYIYIYYKRNYRVSLHILIFSLHVLYIGNN